jgi:tetratricopeptide (TPR) repeat protein
MRLALFAVLAAGASAQDQGESAPARVQKLIEAGDNAGALAILDEALELADKDATLWLQRAQVRARMGKYEDALADCDRAVALLVPDAASSAFVGEGRAAAVSLRGFLRGQLGDWHGAATDFEQATRLQPGLGKYWAMRSCSEISLGHLDDAIANMSKAIELRDSDEAEYWRDRSYILLFAGRGPAARADLESASMVAKGTPMAAKIDLAFVVLATATGDTTAARDACDRLFASSKEYAGWAALLRWSNAGPDERDAATKRLRDDVAKLPADDALLAELFRLCCDGTGDADGMPLAGRDSTARCPLWFFGACRAALHGRDADARVRYRRCIDTGRDDYVQWRIAVARLRAATPDQPLQPALGVTVAVDPEAKTPALLVTALDADGAAAIQGLKKGDRLTRVNIGPATAAAFDAMTKAIAIGTTVRFVVERDGKTQELRIITGIAP